MVTDTWESRALPILRGAFDAREEGSDLNAGARAAVPDLDLRLYKEEVGALTRDQYLDTAIQGGGGDPLYMIHIRQLLPRGLRAVRAWPSESPADELLQLLAEAQASERDPERKKLLGKLLDAASAVGKDVLAGVLTNLITRAV